jgi:adenylate cyclase
VTLRRSRAASASLGRSRRDDVRVAALTAFLGIALYLGLWHLGPVRTLEGYTLDLRFRLRGIEAPGSDIALVLIDDRSIAGLGRWPWNRTVFADAVERLEAAGARLVVFDLLFSEPDSSLPPDVVAAVRRAAGAGGAEPLALDPERLDADRYFARAMARAGNVLVPFALKPGAAPAIIPPAVRVSAYRAIRHDDAQPALSAQAVRAPVDVIARSAAALGHVNVVLARDGSARYADPVARIGDAYYPSLAVQAARLFLGYAPEEVRVDLGRGLRIGPHRIPTDDAMRAVVDYYGPNGTFPSYSFVDLMRGRLAPEALRGHIVVVGADAAGISDRFPSPFSATLRGSERVATVTDNLLHGDVVVRRPLFWGLDLGMALLGALLLGVLARSLSPYALVGLALALLGVLFTIDYLALARARLWLNLTLPAVVLGATYGAIALAHYLHQLSLTRTIHRAFGRYLHPQLVHSLIATGFESEPGARVATVLFTDVAGFTAMAERMAPGQVVHVLNEYFSAITEPIERHGGLITQYQGDAVLAVFNVPFANADHAAEAVRAALEILAIVGERQFGGVHMATRIGINTGEVVAGSVGSESHVTYTVHGDAVNLAARLETLNKEHGTSLLVSETTAARLGEGFRCERIGELAIRGKHKPVVVYCVAAAGSEPGIRT